MKIRVLILIFSTAVFSGCLGFGDNSSNSKGEWVTLKMDNGNGLTSICFPSLDTGYTVGASAVILKTIDGGKSWHQQHLETVNKILRTVYFINAKVGYAVGDDGYFLRTMNGGESWAQVPNLLWGDTTNFVIVTDVFSQRIQATY